MDNQTYLMSPEWQRYIGAPDIRYIRHEDRHGDNPAYIESIMQLPPELAARVLQGHGIDPAKVKRVMEFQTLSREYRDAPQAYNRRLLNDQAKTAQGAAESFINPNQAVRNANVVLPGDPYSPQRAAQDRAAETSRWQTFEDAEGNVWERDTTGRERPRQLMTGGKPVVKTKELTSSELEALRENAQQVAQVIKALGMMRGETVEGQAGDTEATGWKGFLPDFALQRIDKEGVPTRAVVGNVGSLRIKQRSGGAVPAAEMARLKPFVPAETDDPQTVRDKLALFANEYAKMLEEDVDAFKSGNRRVPVALQKFVTDRVGMARGVMSGRQKAAEALSGQMDPAAVLKAIQDELARRGGG